MRILYPMSSFDPLVYAASIGDVGGIALFTVLVAAKRNGCAAAIVSWILFFYEMENTCTHERQKESRENDSIPCQDRPSSSSSTCRSLYVPPYGFLIYLDGYCSFWPETIRIVISIIETYSWVPCGVVLYTSRVDQLPSGGPRKHDPRELEIIENSRNHMQKQAQIISSVCSGVLHHFDIGVACVGGLWMYSPTRMERLRNEAPLPKEFKSYGARRLSVYENNTH